MFSLNSNVKNKYISFKTSNKIKLRTMNIKPADKTIKALLKSGRQFMIPRFQRDYSWEKKNCEEFLDDIIKCLKCKDGKLETTSYFLGTMLFIGNFDEKSDKEIQVVDGQQRITTITILFSAISDIFREKGEDNLSKLIDNGNSYQNKELFHFLIRFVVLYSEMSTSNKDIIANWKQRYAQSLASDRPEMLELKRRISAIQQKYLPLEIKHGMDIFREINDITLIPDYCMKGIDLVDYLNAKLVPTERESWDCLYQYYDMNNEDFERQYAMTESAVLNGSFRNYQDQLKAISILIELSDLGIKEMNSKVLDTSKAYVEKLIADISSSDSFADIKSNIINLLSSINQVSDNNELRKKFNSSLNGIFATKLTELEHHYTEILENLSDDNLLEIVDSMDKMLPDRSNSYKSYPIFKDANPERVAKRILSLSNASKFHFYRFLNRRYGADTGHFINRELTPDMPVLNEIGKKLSEVVETLTLIDKYAVSSLVELIKKIDTMERSNV